MDYPARNGGQPAGDDIQLTPGTMPLARGAQKRDGQGGDGSSHEHRSYWQRFLLWLDAYQVQERNPDRVGLLVTFVVLPLAISYCIIVAFNMLNAPDPVQTETLWSVSMGPFKMPLRCEVADGCLLSNAVSDRNPGCLWLAHKEEAHVFIEYSDNFLEGPSILGDIQASVTTPIVSVLSEVWMAGNPNADEDGTVFKWTPMFMGTAQVVYLHTENKTLSKSGRDREEFFSVQLNQDGSLVEGSTPSLQLIRTVLWRCSVLTCGMLEPAFTKIVVTPGFSVWTYIGVCSGQYAALLSWGALLVAIYDNAMGA